MVYVIGISPFNSYFSFQNMTRLFKYFDNFFVLIMDEASVHNLMAQGYTKEHAIKRTKDNDKKLYKCVLKSLIACNIANPESKILLFSNISKKPEYIEKYNYYKNQYLTNIAFMEDCINCLPLSAVSQVLLKKCNISDQKSILAMEYLFDELPLWLDVPYLLGLDKVTIVYKELSFYWKKICYDYGFLNKDQDILIKNVENL